MYDVAIIGTGPSGLSCALTLKIRNKNILLIGNRNSSEKVYKAHQIDNYLGIPHVTGEDLAKRMISQVEEMGIKITDDRISTVYSMGSYFALQGKDKMYESRTIVLATGVNMQKPYPGEEEFLGRGVSYCATCDAPFYKQKNVIVIGETENEEEEVIFLASVCSKVLYFPLYKCSRNLGDNVEIITEQPISIDGIMKAESLKCKNDIEYKADGIFILRESISASVLVPGLMMNDNHVDVDRKMSTSIKGCFACGDIVGKPYQYIKSAGEGNIAALSAVEYLSKLPKEEI